MKLSIIIPVYNEEQTIGEVIERVRAVDLGVIEKEIIICNDGSSDGTRAAIENGPWAGDARVRTYHGPINMGKGAAVRMGLHLATGDVMLVQDADLELDPSEYGDLLAPLLAGTTDVVYGSRFLKPSGQLTLGPRLGNRAVTWLTNILFGGRLTDMETAYKVFRREAIAGIRLRCVSFDFEPEVTARLLLAGQKIVEVPVRYHPRSADQGKKLRWSDGFDAVYALLKCRFSGRRAPRASK